MTEEQISVLLIEDNPDYALLMREQLAEARRVSFDLEWVDRLSLGLDRLANGGVDVVLLDLSLPDSSGGDTLRRVQDRAPNIPIVVLTGLEDEALARTLVKDGAQDYLLKDQVDGNLLARSMLYAVERHQLLAELREAKESAEFRLRTVIENIPVVIFALDRAGVFTLCEGRGLEVGAHEPAELVGHSVFEVYRDIPEIQENVRAALQGNSQELGRRRRRSYPRGPLRTALRPQR